MAMHNPPHPGVLISEILEELNLSIRLLADKLSVSPSTLQRVVAGKAAVSPEMALRLSVVLGSSAEMWLSMQAAYDLWQLKDKLDISKLQRLDNAQR